MPTIEAQAPLSWLGRTAFSAFRLDALRERLRADAPTLGIDRVEAAYVYALDAATPLEGREQAQASALLGAVGPFVPDGGVIVAPRPGTVSPWSSKATDIFRNCGLTGVRRVERGWWYQVRRADGTSLDAAALAPVLHRLHDRMTQGIYVDLSGLFVRMAPRTYRVLEILEGGLPALDAINRECGLALNAAEMAYVLEAYRRLGRNPTDVELVMFGQVNSEHCRHKIFNAEWRVDGTAQPHSLFDMIRHTHARHPAGTLVAYSDNSGVLEGFADAAFEPDADGRYGFRPDQMDLIMKVETHNHPTAIAPYPGAATGVGGEIRDEGATGIGARSKAGLAAFMVSHLRLPDCPRPWETATAEPPRRLASALEIMLEGPIGGAGFGNEFGRPQLTGLFRTFETTAGGVAWGYHKPIMVAGGMGVIKRRHVPKHPIPVGALIIQLGGPAMRIGLGGGAASSMVTGSNAEALDFDSVQRDNAEMQRRCQEVINACVALDDANPVLTIHDIGAGGLSNGCPELVAETGGHFQLRAIPNEDASMNPMEIWCCEAQERYVLAIAPEQLERFQALCARERCPMAVLGVATGDDRLILEDRQFGNRPIDIDMGVILGKPPRLHREATRLQRALPSLEMADITLDEAVERVLRFPTVADKTFLITIADRSITGCVTRDQMVGPWQTPVADAAVTVNGYRTWHGQAMAMGERTPVALISGPASGRLAVGEALTNLAGVDIGPIGNVKLSGNWMCACGEAGEDAALFDTVRAVALDLCPGLGIAIPVGKDSLSMRTVWQTPDGTPQKQVGPLSLIVSAFAPVGDVRRTVTPDLKPGASVLVRVDLGGGRNRLGASALAQVYDRVGDEAPDLDDPACLRRFFEVMQTLVAQGLVGAYHDRSDGGLLTTLLEMAFAGHRGLDLAFIEQGEALLAALFSEELGAVLQITEAHWPEVRQRLVAAGLGDCATVVGRPTDAHREVVIRAGGSHPGSSDGTEVLRRPLAELRRLWSETTWRMQRLRDHPDCADEEYEQHRDVADPGLNMRLTYAPEAPPPAFTTRPTVAILREQGVNGQVEMAAAFTAAGFDAFDVHMTDLLAGRVGLDRFAGLVACGGFSYGDVLGAGAGWAACVLHNDRLRAAFAAFFARPDRFALGVCNGCQMMAQLKAIIPGADHWPRFARNVSEQFEARLVTVEVLASPSVLLRDMAGSRLLVPVAHGEGRADFESTGSQAAIWREGLAALRYTDNHGRATVRYPFNPNGSAGGLTGITNADGRVTLMMPHPERAFRACQMSYCPPDWPATDAGPWLRMFQNARQFVRGQ